MVFNQSKMRFLNSIVLLLLIAGSCRGQAEKQSDSRLVGGPCEGCEAIHEYGDKVLTSVDTLPAFDKYKPQIRITGTVFNKDGVTPAKDVILYIYHTNRDGIYETRSDEKGWAKRHGYIRGWIKTDTTGKYTFYTFRPGAYPNGSEPEHIHITVKEPDKNEYYLSDYLFSDDTLLTPQRKRNLNNRGGVGIVDPVYRNNIIEFKRDITLGLNIPDYE